jgi:predicted NBD/HSP70 family sugar kinase
VVVMNDRADAPLGEFDGLDNADERAELTRFRALLDGAAAADDVPDEGALDDPAAGVLRRTIAQAGRLAEARYAVGIELLPHRMAGVVVDERGERLADAQTVLGAMDVATVVGAAAELTAALLDDVPHVRAAGDRVALAFQLGGPVDTDTGMVLFYRKAPPKMPWPKAEIRWPERQPIAWMLRKATGLRTVVENDANAFANMQRWFGAGREVSRLAVVLIREGVGGSIVFNNRIFDGPVELGNLSVLPETKRECDCGSLGCLETTGGAHGILESTYNYTDVPVTDLAHAAELAEAHETRGAVEAFTMAGHANAKGIGVVINFARPRQVIVYAPPVMIDPEGRAGRAFRAEVAGFGAYCHSVYADCKLVFAPIGPYDGAHGAALLALEREFGILPEVARSAAEWPR